MKILVFSDSHRSMNGMYRAVDAHNPDQIIHLGDYLRDAEQLADVYDEIPVCRVPGNCDGWTYYYNPDIKRITLAGKVFLLSHGHTWHVKSTYDMAIAEARKAQADVLLFGHTHHAICEKLEDGIIMMNPGASSSTYGLITIENGWIHASIEDV